MTPGVTRPPGSSIPMASRRWHGPWPVSLIPRCRRTGCRWCWAATAVSFWARCWLCGAEDVALVGYRDFDDNDRFRSEHVRDSGITVLDYRDLRAGGIPLVLDGALATVTKPQLQGFWVHFDVDVLDDAIMPAVDYRHEGGLSWDEAAQLVQGLLSRPGARGLEVTIFNPNLDPDGSIARRLCEFIASCVTRTA